MDELERNDLLPEEEAVTAEAQAEEAVKEEETSEETKLKEELEDLRDLFQNELDKALSGEENAEGEMLIQELEEEAQPEAEEEKEVRLCEYCGEKAADTSFGEDYPYCSDCRKLMKSNPLNAIGVLVLLLVFVVTGYTFGNMMKNADTYITLLDADTAYTSRALTDAANYYQSYLSSATKENISYKAVRNAAYTMADLGYYSDAKTIIDSYFTQESLSEKKNEKLAEIYADYDILMRTSDLINDNFGEALNGGKFDYKKEIKKADKLIEEYKDNAEYNYTFLEYGKYLIMLIDGQSDDVLIKQLQKIEEIDGGKHPWIYLTYLLNTYSNLGDAEKATEVFEKCLSINTQEGSLYNYYANAFRFCEKPDADKVMEIAQLAEKNSSKSAYPVYYRTYALANLLKGENEKALENITKYLSSCQPTVSDFNLYAVCAVAAGQNEVYEEAKSTLEGYGYELSETVIKCKEGKITVMEAITDKEGQI